MTEKWIAITGCNGYIGGQTVLKFKDLGYKIIGVDRNNSSSWLRPNIDIFIQGDFTNAMFINAIVSKNPSTLIHLAGTSGIANSLKDPAPYYVNNVGNTAKLLGLLAERNWKKTVIYSSSSAVYSPSPKNRWLHENDPKDPQTPYGQSKLITEKVLKDASVSYGFKVIVLRYFNPAGADTCERHGQMKQATHVIAKAMETIINKGAFTINGDDYDTPDGTCVRDYIHVEDVAEAHYIAALHDDPSIRFVEYNIGSGKGTSVKEVIAAIERITGRMVLTQTGPRREGDPAYLVANPSSFNKAFGWKAQNSSLDTIIKSAWDWYNSDEYRNRA